MKRSHRWGLAGLLALLGAFALHGCGGGDDKKNPMNPGTAADVTINIVADMGAGAFSPSPDTVTVGQTVSWKNNRGLTHSSTAAGGAWTVDISPGSTSAPITMGTAGTFAYECRFHPSMTATLEVKP